jgi:phosphoglycerate dehydrogenase-like enzyme
VANNTLTGRYIAIAPASAPSWVGDAVRNGGGEVVELSDADALVWTDPRDAGGLANVLEEHPHLKWVQVPFAGVENFIHLIDRSRVWTCGKGVYAEPVAEHALALMLAGMRHVAGYVRAREWSGPHGMNLIGARVTILGGGGITESLLRLLQPFHCHITVVRNNVEHIEGASDVVSPDHLIDALTGADVVVLALSLTPQTKGLLSRVEMEIMEPHAWIVNVARGGHIVTDDLVWALEHGEIGGAALDVTDPEPLPSDHALWSMPNCIITPHVGNTPEMAVPLLAERIRANVSCFVHGEPLIGTVDPERGY